MTPRVFLVRHGETTWAKSGRYTGSTEIELTPMGAAQVFSTANRLVGAGKLLDPSRLAHVFVSPRKRATRTFELLLSGAVERQNVTLTEDIAEWDYGDYEGLKAEEIIDLRKERRLDTKWDIWSDGCEGGESMKQVTERLDRLISQIREIQSPYMKGEKPVDVLLVRLFVSFLLWFSSLHASAEASLQIAHGLILRCFVKRWLGFPINFSLQMMMAPGGVAVLSYKHNNVDKPAFYVGMALPYE